MSKTTRTLTAAPCGVALYGRRNSERGAEARRTIRSLPVAALITVTAMCSISVLAQTGGVYNITKSTIDGGGVTFHTGGVYRLGGTVGQHDAARLTGGDYKLTGGFWSPVIPPTPEPDPTGLKKSRFISFSISTSVFAETALRVELASLHHVVPPYPGDMPIPFTLFEGQSMWVGPPVSLFESGTSGASFMASKLQCNPYYQDWSTISLLHVTGEAITPSSTYQVENLAASCLGNEATCTAVSAPLTIVTARFGDVIINEIANFADIGALVSKFQNKPGAPIKARAKLAGDARGLMNIATNVGFNDIAVDVDAFKGKSYPYRPGKCTGDVTKACISDSDCTAQSTTGPCILCP